MGTDAPIDGADLLDLVVVGAGPVGLAAVVYASSEDLPALVVDGVSVGGRP